jgi:GT2 family glycosyltransferase
LVSILILTRDGAETLGRLLQSLDRTIYRAFEVVVVDNGSTDGTAEVLNIARSYAITTVRNEQNSSFSAGNQQAVEVAAGELLLFLNDDVVPVNDGWLGSLVDAIESGEDVVAAGAVLLYPARGDLATDLSVQHQGIRLGFRNKAVHAFNMGANDPIGEMLAGTVDVPAATAAALLVRTDRYTEVGGFSSGYVYGTEDVDLCLRLKELGRIVIAGEAILYHYESTTQSRVGSDISRINRLGNWQQFSEVWGPRATRSATRDRLTGAGSWTSDLEKVVAITLTEDDPSKGWGDYFTAHELGDAFEAEGWRVVYAERHQDHWYHLDDSVDLVVSLLEWYDARRAPDGAVTIAWVRNWVDRWLDQPWFDHYDVVATSSSKAAHHISKLTRFNPAVIPLASNGSRFHPGPPNPTFECDFMFTGNYWGVGRELVDLIRVRPHERFMVFGKGWENEPRLTRYWRGSVSYELLPQAYRSTKVVLDDTSIHTLPFAFVNSRVFDALASGALVLTNNHEGSEELFDGLLPTYSDAGELRAQLDFFLANETARTELVNKLRHMVLENHSYATRPGTFVDLALEYVESPHAAIKIVDIPTSFTPTQEESLAVSLAASLTSHSIPTQVHERERWDTLPEQAVDIVIHVHGYGHYVPKPAHLNVLWVVSRPESVTPADCDGYDFVAVTSENFRSYLETATAPPVITMPEELLRVLKPMVGSRKKDLEGSVFG